MSSLGRNDGERMGSGSRGLKRRVSALPCLSISISPVYASQLPKAMGVTGDSAGIERSTMFVG